jgi:hypothetical protein
LESFACGKFARNNDHVDRRRSGRSQGGCGIIFPRAVKQALTKWRAGFPTTIDDRDVQVIEGNTPRGVPVKLYFDPESGLLVRQVRYIDTSMGFTPRKSTTLIIGTSRV